MRIRRLKQPWIEGLLVATLATALSGWAQAAETERIDALEEKVDELTKEIRRLESNSAVPEEREEKVDVEELEEKVDVLAEEMGRLKSIFTVPEDEALTSFYGLGPAASKVYKRDHGRSIGGYGEVRLRHFTNTKDDNQDDIFDAVRAVLYVGYKFNDNWVMNSEFEFEHAGTGGSGSVSTEFLTLDYLHCDELHEPTVYYGAERPEVERLIIPSTWRENGAGVFGTIADRVHYRMYAINSMKGEKFSSSGLRSGRQKGSKALANDFAFVGRIDVDVADGLLFGGSVYVGQTGQEQDFMGSDGVTRNLPDALLTLYELHAQYKAHGLSLRGLWTQAFIDEAGNLSRVLELGMSEAIANRMYGYYLEAAYDILPLFMPDTRASLEPYFRFENYDTQARVPDGFTKDRSKNVELYVAGLQFKPIPQVVFKVDYRRFDVRKGHKADQVQALVGYAF
ncbi:MAG: hypothetical protein JRJ58_11145 [Deltaproteobacteria bacterium]|nr:hypothetical protein [Deltaproteobacteria bacterium]